MFVAKDVEEVKTHVLCSITFFLVENHAVYKIMWKKYATGREAEDANCVPGN
jgi:hypothetical protein